MRILLVSYHYPPDRAVGGRRAEKVAESLRAAGHEVIVIAAGEDLHRKGLHRISPLPSPRDMYALLRDKLGSQGSKDRHGSSESSSDGASPPPEKIPFWKRWVYSLMWLPDPQQGFILPVVRLAMKLVGRQPNVFYTTSPPPSVHLAGLLLKVLTGGIWIAEFRDPWTSNPWKPDYMKSALSDWLDAKIERLCLDTADLLVPTSEGIEACLVKTGTTTSTVTVRNGIEQCRTPDEVAADVRIDGSYELVYTGEFYHSRDPFPLLDAVRKLIVEDGTDSVNLRIRFIGGMYYEGRSIQEYVRSKRLERYVHVEGWVDPERALRCIHAADALLLLALDQPDQVPNKLYEYLGARRPILAVADADGESARMLRQAGGHIVVPVNEEEPIRAALELLLEKGERGPVGDRRMLEQWTTEVQMAKLRLALEGIEA